MDPIEFARLVAEMRQQQRRFFGANSGSYERADALDKAKPLERRVDKALAEILSPAPQRSLFGPEVP